MEDAARVGLAGLSGLGVSAALTPVLVRRLGPAGLLDVANDRSSHVGAVPRGGGIAVIAGALVGLGVGAALGVEAPWPLAPTLVVVVVGLAVLGLLDDLHSRSAVVRLGLQVVAAAVAVIGVDAALTDPSWWSAALIPVAVVFVVGYVNAFNFMDGVNGIAGLTALAAGATTIAAGAAHDLPALAVLGAVLVGGAAGFVPANLGTARIFLGDVGSYGIGAWIAIGSLACAWWTGSVLVAVAPLAIYLADTGWTLVRRARRHEPLLSAHREHVYQRLTDVGWSHTAVACLVAGLSAACGLAAVAAEASAGTPAQIATAGAIAAVAVAYLASPGWLGRRAAGATGG